MRYLIPLLVFGLFSTTVNADLGVLVETENDTVMKIKYSGATPNSAHPAAVVKDKRIGLVAEANNTSSARALIGAVSSFSLPDAGGAKVGVMGAGTYGVMGKGSDFGVHGEGTGTTGVVGSGGVSGVDGTGNLYGIRGEATNHGGVGVSGTANVTSGVGVSGSSTTSGGIGVRGWTSGSNAKGVYGEGAVGVHGKSSTSSSFGVHGENASGVGVKGIGSVGMHGIGDVIGVEAEADYGYWAWGVYASSHGSSSPTSVGVETVASGGGNNYGIVADAYGGTGEEFAGIFYGDVVITGNCCGWPSDRKFKKNAAPLAGVLGKLMALRPMSYDMRNEEYNSSLSLARGKQYGLMADELKQEFPDMVKTIRVPSRRTREEKKADIRKDPMEYESVDYVALIPVLIKAMQEQQALIEDLQRRLGGQ